MTNKEIKKAQKGIYLRSLRIALVVGSLLAAINYGDKIYTQDMSMLDWVKLLLTYTVPFAVASYSAIQASKSR